MKAQCPSCGSHEIDFSDAGGDAVCVVCGTVCEESTIVSSLEFSENATTGASSVVGQFVSASCTKPYGGTMRGGSLKKGSPSYRYGFLRSSRETTLATGRRRIAQVASSLRLGGYYVDGAHRLFSMAAQRNFTQGRKTLHVACACLYVICRRERSAHMLIDFSDVLQVNVYALGATFLKFRRLLNLELPIIDPSLYIHRFASKLDLGDKTAAVATTALRVVQRMKRDWIETGRRPAGVCAAALLVGARAHGFDRNRDDVVKALRVGGVTVASRLADFQRTPAARLSLKEFQDSDGAKHLPSEEDPPSFAKHNNNNTQHNRQRAAMIEQDRSLTHTTNRGALLVGGGEGGEGGGGDSSAEKTHHVAAAVEALAVVKALPATEEERQAMPIGQLAMVGPMFRRKDAATYSAAGGLSLGWSSTDAAGGGQQKKKKSRKRREACGETAHPERRLYDEIRQMLDGDRGDEGTRALARRGETSPGGGPSSSLHKKKKKKHNNAERDDDDDESVSSETNFDDFVDDDEIAGVVLSQDEMQRKKAIWTEMHKDYLKEQEDKDKLQRARAEARGFASARGHSRTKSKSKRASTSGKRKRKAKDRGDRTASEALMDVVEKKRFSRKINYEALRGIFGGADADGNGARGGQDEPDRQPRQRKTDDTPNAASRDEGRDDAAASRDDDGDDRPPRHQERHPSPPPPSPPRENDDDDHEDAAPAPAPAVVDAPGEHTPQTEEKKNTEEHDDDDEDDDDDDDVVPHDTYDDDEYGGEECDF